MVLVLCTYALGGAWGLEGVVNLDRFHIPDEAKTLLERNGFVVCPANHWQPFFIYEDNSYQRIPNFVTVDSVLHLYHLFFNFALAKLEEERFLPLMERFTSILLSKIMKTYESLPPGGLKEASLRNLAYVGVASNLLKLKTVLPPEVQSMVSKELALIRSKAGLVEGSIFPYAIDYTQFIPRGHYTRSERLRSYFMAMTWYGLVPFSPIYRDPDGRLRVSDTVALQIILLVENIYSAGLKGVWDMLFIPLNYFVGFSDDLNLKEVKGLLTEIYGREVRISEIANPSKLRLFIDRLAKLREPRIKPKIAWLAGTLPNMPDPDSSQFRLLGQRYIPDSELLEKLSDPQDRPIPCGLDLMAVMGSRRAIDIIDGGYRVHGLPEAFSLNLWGEYPKIRSKLMEEFSRLRDSDWTSNLYWNWLWVLKSLIEPPDERCPSFMRTTAWQDKSLQTALASWAQLRHDTILHAKQSLVGAEGGDGYEEIVKGYVEPNVEAWRRLLLLIQGTRKLFNKYGLNLKPVVEKLGNLEDMVDFLMKCSEKELNGEPLSDSEYLRLETIGGEMDFLALYIISDGKATHWMEIVHPSDRNMACVADVHTADIRLTELGHVALEEAVGYSHEIFVLVPIEGKIFLARGAVFNYYEFLRPAAGRLSDEEWQRMLQDGMAPPQPDWTGSFTSKETIRIRELPVR